MPLRRFCFVWIPLFCFVLLHWPVAAQEKSAGSSAAEKFAQVYGRWNEIDGKLKELAEKYRSAAADQQVKLRERYVVLVEQANIILVDLRGAASGAYSETPNADRQVVRVLIGVVANDIANDQYDTALETSRLLLNGGCTEKALYDLAGIAAYGSDDFEAAQQYFNSAKKANALSPTGQIYADDIPQAKELFQAEQAVRKASDKADDLPRVELETSKGKVVLELYENEAPQTVGNFVRLVEDGFYDGLTFHRVLPGFMAQSGCPEGTGRGGPGYKIYCECEKENRRAHFRGTLSMAHAGKDTGGSQFFLTFLRTAQLDGRHTAFGRVIEGYDTLAKLQRIDPSDPRQQPDPDKIIKATVLRKRDHTYQPTKVQSPPVQ